MEKPGLVLRHEPIRDHPDAVRVIFEGSVDPKTAPRMKDELQALAARGVIRFFLDCARLTYINSSGLAYLLNLAGGVKSKGGTVALAALDSKILVVFKMMGIEALFQFYPSFIEALREIDAKLARELADVGPALKLEEPPPPAAPTPTPGRSTSVRNRPRNETERRVMRPPVAVPPANPILRFFRGLFGLSEPRPRVPARTIPKRR